MNREDGTGCDGSSTIFLALCLDRALCPRRLLFKACEMTGWLHTRTFDGGPVKLGANPGESIQLTEGPEEKHSLVCLFDGVG